MFGRSRTFNDSFRCHSVSLLAAEQQRDPALLEYSDKIILPPSCLEKLAQLEITYPMIFELLNPNFGQRRLHCGVLEFIAQEGMVYMPHWMMENMHLNEGDIVHLRSATIQKGSFVKLQPQTTDFIKLSNPKAVLEQALKGGKFSALTKGETFRILHNKKKYDIGVVQVRGEQGAFAHGAAEAVCIIEADVEVDFEAPADYVEPPRPSPPSASPLASSPLEKSPVCKPMGDVNLDGDSSDEESAKPKAFEGSGFRLDGKAIKAPKTNSPAGNSLLSPGGDVSVGIRIGPQGNVLGSSQPLSGGQTLGGGQALGGAGARLPAAPKAFQGSAITPGQTLGGGDSKPGDYWAKFEGGNRLR